MPRVTIQRYDWILSERERYPILWSAYTGDLAELRQYLEHVKDVKQIRDVNTNTSILGWAVVGNQVAIIKYLIGRYPQLLTLTNKYGASPLFLCSVSGNVDMFKLFVNKGLSPYRRLTDRASVLMLTAARGHLDLTRYIVETYPDMLRETLTTGIDIFLLSCYSGSVDMFQYMLQLNFDPTISDMHGINCLMIAAWRGHEKLLRYILKNASRLNINIQAKDTRGNSAVYYAMYGEHPHIIDILSEAGIELPENVSRQLDKYLRLFPGHTERYRHVRVVLVGPENVGKTTLCLRLQSKAVDISVRRSTMGAELFLQLYEIGWDSKRWIRMETDNTEDVIHMRLGAILRTMDDNGISPSGNSEIMDDNGISPSGNSEIMDDDGISPSGSPETMDDNGISLPDKAVIPDTQTPLPTNQTDTPRKFRFTDSSLVRWYSEQQDEDMAFLSMWDMGGDLAFQATNSLFISAHGVYIVTFRAIDYFTDDMQMERLKNWVRNIGAYSHVYNPGRQRKHLPPIILVGTHMDKVKAMFKEMNWVMEERILDMQKQMSTITELTITRRKEGLTFAFLKFCTVDNSIDDDQAFEKIRGYILEAAAYQDQWERELPASWLALERDILEKRQQHHNVITLREVKDMGAKCELPIKDEEEIKMFLEYLHSTRCVLYFRKYKKVIINPQWVINALREILTDEKFLPTDDLLLATDLIKYTTNAILTVKLAKKLWQYKGKFSYIQHSDILFAFLEEFGLLVKACRGQGREGKPVYDDDYTVPSKLQKAPDMDRVSDLLKGVVCSRTLCLVFEDVFTPQELFDRIYAGIIATFKPAETALGMGFNNTNQERQIYKDLGCFKIDDLCNMVVRMQWEQSMIGVTLFTTLEPHIPDDTGKKVRQKLETIIRHTLEVSRQEHLEYRYKLHCRFYLKPSDNPREEDGIVRTTRGLPCQGEGCSGKHTLTKRDWHIWFPESKNMEVNNKRRSYESGLLTDKGLQSRVADKLGAGWECVIRHLNVPNNRIERIKIDHVGSSLNQITTALIDWRDNYPKDRPETDMLRDLSEAFRENGVNSDVIDEELMTRGLDINE